MNRLTRLCHSGVGFHGQPSRRGCPVNLITTKYAGLAQLVEHPAHNRTVPGSIPRPCTIRTQNKFVVRTFNSNYCIRSGQGSIQVQKTWWFGEIPKGDVCGRLLTLIPEAVFRLYRSMASTRRQTRCRKDCSTSSFGTAKPYVNGSRV